MNHVLIVGIVIGFLAMVAVGGLGWQLVQQNGRMLLRIEALEKAKAEHEQPPDEIYSAAAENGVANTKSEEKREDRFSNRSLASSKIKRDGLKAGMPAPEFRLPRLDGGELALSQLRGQVVLLVFSSPHCGPCNTLAPKLEKFYRKHRRGKMSPWSRLPVPGKTSPVADRAVRPQAGVASLASPSPPLEERAGERRPFPSFHSPVHGRQEPVSPIELVMISRESQDENRAKVKEHGLTFPVVLQKQWEVSRAYAYFATPVAYLIDAHGIIAADVAVGVDDILDLLPRVRQLLRQREAAGHRAVYENC